MDRNATEAALQLDLSQEELLYVLRLTGVPTLPGLDDDAVTDLDEKQLGLVLGAGEHGLRARGLLQDDASAAKGVALWEGLLGLVGTCVMAPHMAVVRPQPLGAEAASLLYYFGQELTVEHASGGPGVHRFKGFVDRRPVLERIAASVSVPPAAPEGAGGATPGGLSGSVPSSLLELARDLAVERQDTVGAVERLNAGGMAPDVAEAFAASLGRLQSVVSLAFLRRHEDAVQSGGMVVLQEPEGFWILEPGDQDDPLVECLYADAATVRARLHAALGLENA